MKYKQIRVGNMTKKETLNASDVSQRRYGRWPLGVGMQTGPDWDSSRPESCSDPDLLWDFQAVGVVRREDKHLTWFPSIYAAERRAEETTGTI